MRSFGGGLSWLVSLVLSLAAAFTTSAAPLDVSMATLVALAATAMGSGMAAAGERLTTATTSSDARARRRTMA